MTETSSRRGSEPLSGEDLGFWWGDQPHQRTAMAMLMLLDRRPSSDRLRAAAAHAARLVPRLRQRVVDDPLDLARPRWEDDPTFDLDFHVRRYALSHEDGAPQHADLKDLFRTIGPIYERPFDRTRPLWELIELDGPGDGAAIFFRLHHCMADGVGGNAILAALTEGSRDELRPMPVEAAPPGPWREPGLLQQLRDGVLHRVEEETERAGALARFAWDTITTPSSWSKAVGVARGIASQIGDSADSPLEEFGRSRHLTGFDLPFEPLRQARRALGGQMIDLMLSAASDAMGEWHRAHGYEASDVMTLVPINLRPRAEQGVKAVTGNRATGVMVPLPLEAASPPDHFREVHARMSQRKSNPALEYLPTFAEAVSVVPRRVFRMLSYLGSQAVQLIVTNVPGIMVPRYIAGARITAGYPFAPLAPRCPVSIALYGYDDRLWVGIDADGTAMPDVEEFSEMLRKSFERFTEAGARHASAAS